MAAPEAADFEDAYTTMRDHTAREGRYWSQRVASAQKHFVVVVKALATTTMLRLPPALGAR